VQHLPEDSQSAAIVQAIVQLARVLDLHVIAEGIEAPEAVDALRLLSCEEGQGFLFGRPMPADKLESVLLGTRANVLAS
jgi:EAL domain-containing protein (putative c-di-GMP-specific phosphodiesterase class I)